MPKRSKRFLSAVEKIDFSCSYRLKVALDLLLSLPAAKFDETVEVAVCLGVDPRKAEENVRGTVLLPNGTGRTVRLAVFCKADRVKDALGAGADFAGAEDLVEKVQSGWLEFDAVVATPDMMVSVGKVGRILGPRGLMPNPKVGTVTNDIVSAVKAVKSGRVEFRVEKAGVVHIGVGKRSFGTDKLEVNISAFVDALNRVKPKSAKGVYLRCMSVCSTMGPGLSVDVSSFVPSL